MALGITEPSIDSLREHFRAWGQGHVFRFWDRLDAAGRRRLARQAAEIDLAELARAHQARSRIPAAAPELEPVEAIELPERGGDPARLREARARGEEMLAAGRIAALVVAGGQGTRLGFEGPKGAFPLGPVTGRTLFEQQAQKIRGLRRTHGCALPWLVMTSDATDADTRGIFERHRHFGLPAEDVFFFCQGMIPSLDFDGRLILERPDRIFENPNGHGGCLTALEDSGALDALERRGIDTIFYYQVDNPLVRLGDPVYLGLHEAAGAEMSCKVVRKRDPSEKVGVLARSGGRVCVVEYTELEDRQRHARGAGGELVFWAGNLAIHVFDVAFVRRVAARAAELLPYHASVKKIATLDAEGRPLQPREPNGHKLERFVFDALPAARAVCIVEARRADEYSPVKNAEGADSPATARRDLMATYRAWLEAAGIALPPGDAPIEIDHSRVDGPADARALGIRSIAEAPDVIRTSPGARA